jgi:Ser/Thr protein kinase RdoA (MazF antagonist)
VEVWRDPWDDAPFPELSAEQLTAIVGRHELGVALDQISRLRSTGVVHTVYALGDAYVLRVPKPIPDATTDTYTESVAAPVARDAGVRTPALIVFDDERDIVEVPYTVFERWDGEGLVDLGSADRSDLWRAVGRDLATLHLNVADCPDPNNWLDEAGRSTDIDDLLAAAVAEGAINSDNAHTRAVVRTASGVSPRRQLPAISPQ